jgi:catechol 2,3-dioxygenase-like lactoylglutathione lyase family enzyme
MSSVSELEHVLVLSDDIDAARDFYERAVGLRTGERPPLPFDGYWLYAGDSACLHIADRASYRAHAQTMGLAVHESGAGTPGSGPVDHIAFRAADDAAVSERLERAGVTAVLNEVPGGGPRQFFVHAPDGVRVEINVHRR